MKSFIINSKYFSSFKSLSNNQLTEIGYNVITDNGQIKEPELTEKRSNLYFISLNEIFQKISKKEDLTERDIIRVSNSGMGNCFYKTISQFFYNKENYHYYIRKKISELIITKINEDKEKYPYIYNDNNTITSFMDYFNKLILTGTY